MEDDDEKHRRDTPATTGDVDDARLEAAIATGTARLDAATDTGSARNDAADAGDAVLIRLDAIIARLEGIDRRIAGLETRLGVVEHLPPTIPPKKKKPTT